MTRAHARGAAVAIGLLLVTGCAHAGGNPRTAPTTALPPPTSSDSLVLQVSSTGGFMGPGWWQAELPLLSVYSDGRAISQGPVPLIYPGPALPRLFVKRLDPATLHALVDAAVAAGVADTTDLGRPSIADAVTTRFTVVTGSHRYVREVYALGADPAGGLSPEQQAARAKLQDLQQRLGQAALRSGLEEPYAAQTLAVLAGPWTDPQDQLDHPPATWPGPALPGQPMRTRPGTGCVTVTGDQASAVLAAAAKASELTPWVTPDGAHWHVGFRPLLPDETGCADLEG